jgi:hypothetical protein
MKHERGSQRLVKHPLISKAHLHGGHPCPMHIVERKRKEANPNGTFKTMMLSMITNLVEGEKLKGNQAMHLWGWTISFTKANREIKCSKTRGMT